MGFRALPRPHVGLDWPGQGRAPRPGRGEMAVCGDALSAGRARLSTGTYRPRSHAAVPSIVPERAAIRRALAFCRLQSRRVRPNRVLVAPSPSGIRVPSGLRSPVGSEVPVGTVSGNRAGVLRAHPVTSAHTLMTSTTPKDKCPWMDALAILGVGQIGEALLTDAPGKKRKTRPDTVVPRSIRTGAAYLGPPMGSWSWIADAAGREDADRRGSTGHRYLSSPTLTADRRKIPITCSSGRGPGHKRTSRLDWWVIGVSYRALACRNTPRRWWNEADDCRLRGPVR